MKNFFSSIFSFFFSSWWIKITTAEPNCIYYFGPFNNEAEANQAKPGFIEDLESEGALQIQTSLQQSGEPEQLTIEMETSVKPSAMATV